MRIDCPACGARKALEPDTGYCNGGCGGQNGRAYAAYLRDITAPPRSDEPTDDDIYDNLFEKP
jgi:hypothetical protein